MESFFPGILVIFVAVTVGLPAENDTVLVGSLIHETKIKPPPDLLTAATKGSSRHGGSSKGDGEKDEDDFFNSDSAKGANGYNDYDNFYKKDGDAYGMEEHYAFGKAGGDGKKKAYHKSSSYDKDRDDSGSGKPKYTEWHYEHKKGSPPKTYRYESEDTEHNPQYHPSGPDVESKGKLVGPKYQSLGDASRPRGRNPRKKKEQLTAATEYDNLELYGEVEEPDAPAEAEEVDPEYEAVYADPDYTYY